MDLYRESMDSIRFGCFLKIQFVDSIRDAVFKRFNSWIRSVKKIQKGSICNRRDSSTNTATLDKHFFKLELWDTFKQTSSSQHFEESLNLTIDKKEGPYLSRFSCF
jgi:hypothetical protein